MRKLLSIASVALIVACTPAQIKTAQVDQALVQSGIDTGCAAVNGAMALAAPFSVVPQVGAIMDYGAAACGTAEAVAALTTKALNDPNTVAWVEKLAVDIKGSVGQ